MTLPMLIAPLSTQAQRRFSRGVRWKIFDGILAGSVMLVAFGSVIWAASGTAPDWLIAALITVTIALMALRYAAGAMAIRATYPLTFEGGTALRHRLLRRLVRLPLGAFYKLHPGKVAHTLSEDLMWLENNTSYFGPMARAEVATLAILLTGTAVLHWPAAVVTVFVWCAGLLVLRKLARNLATGFRFRSDGIAEAARHFMEYAEGIQVVRAFGDTEAARRDYSKWIEIMREGFRKGIARNTPVAILAQGLSMAAVGLGALVTIFTLPESGALRALGAIGLLTATLIPARAIIISGMIRQLAITAEQNVNEIEALETVQEGDVEALPGPAHITFQGVSFSYDGERAALSDISFETPPGTVTAIVGRSGSGKTTLASLLLRFWERDAGKITYNTRDIRDYTVRSLANRFAPVFQETMLLRDTVSANIRIGRPDATEDEVVAAAKAAQVHDTIMALPMGYDTKVGPGGQTLSGGERQRVTIARAILKDADVVILDEATSALDPENEREIQLAFEALAKDKTVFVIAHRLSTIVDADQILLLDEGRIVAKGTHAQLMSDAPLYRALWDNYQAITEWTL
ncbi:MAG: ABC transporter ATP-binding protein [Pseudomonadota bacterium]